MRPSMPGVITNDLLQHTSVAKVLSGNISLGAGDTFDANAVPLTYTQGNGEGRLIRHTFTGVANETITHSLGRVPIGYFVTRSNIPVVLSDDLTNAGWDKYRIVLKANAAADAVVYIF